MTEYLDRESVLGILDGFLKAHEKILDNPPECNLVYHAMRKLPTADVVEVVRCQDCKYKDDCARQMVHTTRDYVLEQNISTYNKVDFCSYGEAKMDGKGEGE